MNSVAALPTRALLSLYGSILDECIARGVARTRNSPVGDYAETLAAVALDGVLEPNSNKSWDVTTRTGQRVQVKARTVGPRTARSGKFSPFRSFAFDAALFIVLAEGSYEVSRATWVPASSVEERARFSAHAAGAAITLGTDLLKLQGAQDLTDSFRAAADIVDDLRANS